MSTKFIRFAAALAIIVSVIGNTGVGYADRGVPPRVSTQNLETRRAPAPQPLTIPAASSLGVQFIHVATAANINAHTTLIDNPLTNLNPNAIILVTPNNTPGVFGGTLSNHHTGVFYNGPRSQWGIYNEDGATMQVGTAFNVIIPTAGAGVFVQTTLTISNYTTINNSLTDGNPNAVILVTPNFNPGNAGGTNANFPISVLYNNILNNWRIFKQDGTDMPAGTGFNVFVLTAGAGIFVHKATVNNTPINYTIIDNALTNGNFNAIVFVTQVFNPGGVGGTVDEHPIGVYYNGNQWYIVNQDAMAMPLGASFNVLVLVPHSDIFVHTASTGNSAIDFTKIDNALTNGNPNAIAFTTPNYNPGGVGGTYNIHNIGVTYNGSQWRIFNQNGSSIPVNAAFNVLVPNPDASVFVHTVTAANTYAGYTTIIDYPLANGHQNAILLVTQNNNPGNVGGSSDDHPFGVMYSSGKWVIFNQDLAAMPLGAAFNVFIPTAGPGVEVFVHKATPLNTVGKMTVFDKAQTNGNPNAIVVVTPNYNPDGVCPCVSDSHPIGVAYAGDAGLGHWVIFNQDGVNMPVNAAFNVYIFPNYKVYLPEVLR